MGKQREQFRGGLGVRRAKADVLDFKAMRRALKGADVLFHTVGFVGSNPAELVWRMNAHAPVVAVEAAAAEGLKRVVLTSTISAIGPATNGRPASELTEYPRDWLGLAYPDSKHEGELAALDAGERHGIEVVVVNPAYLLGVPCITMRHETEWPETVATGWNVLVGANTKRIVAAAASFSPPLRRPSLFGDGCASDHIARLLTRLVR